ncbi:N-acetylglutamate kinase [Prosthecobacter debontii]|uniref:Acetylglutamate kinase n=1 Tax=Prosthecobacter debontii TaxID=48467 RepID=A0A1T4YJW0_9BACT|nr:acetylglutamate kinase [Prosthecobacter debontii]SKB02079.1 N-acetylglutamate kinase [Prosthecobacter debontii]
MNDNPIQKADVLLEALPYMQGFRGCTFLIKVGGSAMEDPAVVDTFLKDVVFLEAVGINPVIVHGGGKAISKAMKDSGLEAKFINGMRVTDEETIKIVEETLARVINPEIVNKINAFGGKAVGVPGTEVFTGEKMKGDLGWVGEVNDCKLGLIQAAVAGEFVPVVSPVAREQVSGRTLNVNADLAACALATRMKATKLIFLSDVRGVMRDPKDNETLIPSLDPAAIEGLKKEGIISGGMIPKVDSSLESLRGGVGKVHLIDGRIPHALILEIFTDVGIGTEIHL